VAGDKAEDSTRPFTGADVRFTQKDGALYAILLDWPTGEAVIRSIPSDAAIERVTFLGGPALPFSRDSNGLRLTIPPPESGAFVPALRIEGRGLA
jgi:alpha-L-fucosidase